MKGARSLILVVALIACARDAAAAEPTAAELYDRGAAAYDAGEYARAVVELAHADAIAPDPVTLELALKASLRADDAARGMDLAERAGGRQVPSAVSALAAQARGRFTAHAGKVHASCDAPCEARLDDAPIDKTSWATIGRHTVSFQRNGRVDRVAVTVIAESTAEAAAPPLAPLSAAPSLGPAKAAEAAGPSPVWFWIGAGVTVAAGIATGLSASDTAAKHDAFALDQSNTAAAQAGTGAQTRTNVLAVVTGGVAVATLALGVFVVRW